LLKYLQPTLVGIQKPHFLLTIIPFLLLPIIIIIIIIINPPIYNAP